MTKAIRLAVLSALACTIVACTAPDEARLVLDYNGFTDIKIVGYAPYACADGDEFATRFEATNPRGKHVTGVVCSSAFGKNATIRW
jgi:hypothetical protein